MQVIAEGKDAVLHFLENETLRRTNEQSGVYLLQRDDAGTLVLHIEGWTFVGTGSVSINGNLLTVVDGTVANINKPS